MTPRSSRMPARPDRHVNLPERPDRLPGRPAGLPSGQPGGGLGDMDPLSDVMRAVRLTGAYFFNVVATHPWSAPAAPADELVPRVLPDAEHLIPYHIIVSGSCWGGVDGEPQVPLE